ncbi:unnamed protein product [Linum tenue]|uniref:Nucleoporin autopeptidase n=1 Tax=Linum tenue TaxID=586396 RepID=A0AAV0M647_9ROSI|nr:unnamed protein product [Linum tenue]
MFGSPNPFGQTSSSPFGSSGFGQTSAPTNNPFAPKPFGSPAPFGSQTGTSMFGGTSTGMFGTPQTSSPFPSTTTFGASSSPAFGSSMPAFGASSTPAFNSSSSTFGGSSGFGQKPAFGGFGSSTTPSPFGGTNQQSQPAFGSSLFGSTTPFGAGSQPGFGGTSTPAFGSTSTPAFGSTTTPAFGAPSTSAFGATSTPAFGSTASPAFGSTGAAFGVSSTPGFGSSVFGSSSTPAFGASSSPVFGAASSPAFGASSAQTFGASSTPSFSFASNSAFGQSTSAFGSSPFGAQSSGFGSQATTPTFASSGFGQAPFGTQRGGSRAAPYTATPDTETTGTGGQAGKLESISAMPVYKEKSHEELRWEDYQSGDKGGPTSSGQQPGAVSFNAPAAQSNPFAPSSAFAQTSANPFSATTSSNPFAPKAFAPSATSAFSSSPFSAPTAANPFQSSSFPSSSSSPFASTSPSLFGPSSTTSFASTPSLFTSSAQGTTSTFNPTMAFPNSSSTLFQSTAPSLSQPGSGFGPATSSFGPSSTSPFGPSNAFSTPGTSLQGSLFSSTPSLFPSTNPVSNATPFQLPQSSFSNFSQSQGGTSLFSNTHGQNNYAQHWSVFDFCRSIGQSTAAVLPAPVTNPFGTLPAMPQISISRAGTTPSVQYGISSLPVVDKPAPVRVSSLLTSRHLLQRRIKMPARKYNPKHDGPKVPFFSNEDESSSTPKADALFVPRENPRALTYDCVSLGKVPEAAMDGDDVSSLNGTNKASDKDKNLAGENGLGNKEHVELNQKLNGRVHHEDHSSQKLNGHRAGEAAIVYEHGADIEAQMPKLRRPDYYTEPRIQELAAKERAESGYCRRVRDFVVGRQGFGSIKFLGETDVRRLDLDAIVQFNTKEVIVYEDDEKKPPVGQGLNKAAVVTLLNIRCVDKATKKVFTEGPVAERYTEQLKRKTKEQDAEFVSYDAAKGEWKFKVEHFSAYKLVEEEEEEEENICENRVD